MIDKTKLKSVEPLMQLVLLDISNLRMHSAKLKKECPDLFGDSDKPICDYWDVWVTDEILEYMEVDIKDLLRGMK